LKPAINCITLAVDDLKKSLAFYRDGLGLPAQFSAELEDGADCTAFELAGDLWLMPMPRAEFCQVHQDRLPARCTARFIGVHPELFRRQQRPSCMKTKSKPTTPFANVPISVWKVSGKPVTIDEFIEEGIGCVDATAFHYALRSLNSRLLEKLESINSDEYPGLREAVQVIIHVFESREA
jgi:hypothetical protein